MYQTRELRNFVLLKFNDGNGYHRKEIMKMVTQEFGEETYTEKRYRIWLMQ